MSRFLLLTMLAAAPLAAAAQLPNVTPAAAASGPRPSTLGAIKTASVPVAAAAEVKRVLAQPNTVLLDVRTPEEFAAGHLPGARNLDFRAPTFAQQVAALNPAQTYVLYCASGNRSGKAAVLMQEKGFPKVINAGAYQTLQQQGLRKP